MHTGGELKELQKRMESSQLKTLNLTTSDLVKDHLRYLVRPSKPISLCAYFSLRIITFPICSHWFDAKLNNESQFIYQMGGRTSVEDEILCRFTFPERPGALMNFLDTFSPRWNISLFHYRAQVCFPTHYLTIKRKAFK